MPMPSLLKYFAFVGAGLLVLLTLANFLLEPSTGARVVAEQPKALVVKHNPQASKIERWRDEQAALKAGDTAQPKSELTPSAPAAATSIVAKATATPSPAPVVKEAVAPAPVANQVPAAPVATPQATSMQSADASANIEGVPTEAERSTAIKRKKADVAKKKRLAEARARKRELADSNRQDEFYYGQRPAPAYGQQSAYAPPPRQDFGPFGWGRGW
jgi:hypothetical protein